MTIASEIQRIKTNIANAYTSCNIKGATMPASQVSDNLATCISSITTGGGGGTGITREVSANGVYQMPATSFTFSLPSNATDLGTYAMYYAFWNGTKGATGLTSVDLSSLTRISGGYALYYAFSKCTSLTSVDLSSVITITGSNALHYAFQYTNITSVDLSSLTTVSGSSVMAYAFYFCGAITSVDLSSLTTVSGSDVMNSAFFGCTSLSGTIDLSSLTTVSGSSAMAYAFYFCGAITSVDLSNLMIIGTNSSTADNSHFSYCFAGCDNITTLTFPKLEKIYCTGGTSTSYGTFANNNKVQKMYFPKLNTITYGRGASSSNQNACKNIFYGCTSLTELHFRAANQSAIKASPGYSTAWGRGAGNVTIYFDL